MNPYATLTAAEQQCDLYAAGLEADADAELDAADLRDLAAQAHDTWAGIARRSPSHPALPMLHQMMVSAEALAAQTEKEAA